MISLWKRFYLGPRLGVGDTPFFREMDVNSDAGHSSQNSNHHIVGISLKNKHAAEAVTHHSNSFQDTLPMLTRYTAKYVRTRVCVFHQLERKLEVIVT